MHNNQDSSELKQSQSPWLILIVDAEDDMHTLTQMVVQSSQLFGRPLKLLHAYSGKEARALFLQHPDIALVLLDIVMESNEEGLALVRFIRDELCNAMTRIVLRTGQERSAPELQTLIQYDINDYKMKSELTLRKLQVSILTALRGYRDLTSLKASNSKLAELNQELDQRIVDTSNELDQTLQSLTSTQKKLIETEKMASLGVLSAGIAHEINNPLSFIKSNISTALSYQKQLKLFTRTCLKQQETSPETDQPSRRIDEFNLSEIDYIMEDFEPLMLEALEGVNRVKNIVDGLKSFASHGPVDMCPVDLNSIIHISIDTLRSRLGSCATILTELSPLPPIQGNEPQLKQALYNLLENAAEAIDTHGKIRIHSYYGNSENIIEIEDNGTGISEQHIEEIFTPFFTTRGVGEGTGLGLSISHGIIRDHGGNISVKSKPGQGCCFTLKFPIQQTPGCISSST
ncbi:hybrid sensor histidine kinase/response regulator [Dongshaea marina]|uniref:hybrid sensor histidine kinase/response regulator n=1 Tax=Dongshaea marina TaxID=2047966 RepID=UPI000D3E0C02|nr:ATP-binding protein [Dongshaea marina]